MSVPTLRTLVPLAGLAVIAAAWLQAPATAGEVPMVATGRTAEVSTRDLNLANPADVAQLDARIQRAAAKVCAPENIRDLAAVADRPSCMKTAITSAAPKRDTLVARAQQSQMAARSEPGTIVN
jgi:UrcA family protein